MKITIIGCGNMGRGLAQRLSKSNELVLYDRHLEKAEQLSQEGNGKVSTDLMKELQVSEMIILAIKPQNISQIAEKIAKDLKKTHLIVSLLAGTPLSTLAQKFPSTRIVRMMPNLPLICGEGVVGISPDVQISETDKKMMTQVFEPLGKIYWLPEDKLEALGALAGSGPAFFFVFVEAMIDAGIAMGFSAKDAKDLVHQMVQGSLVLLKQSSKHPGELKWQVSSPQGTTIAGLRKLEELAVRGGIMNTFLATYERAKELSSHLENK